VDQQKALIFDADSRRYDVILGAEFLSKTGINVKYNTGTIEWFTINCHCNPNPNPNPKGDTNPKLHHPMAR
jgi:hypothetical protein